MIFYQCIWQQQNEGCHQGKFRRKCYHFFYIYDIYFNHVSIEKCNQFSTNMLHFGECNFRNNIDIQTNILDWPHFKYNLTRRQYQESIYNFARTSDKMTSQTIPMFAPIPALLEGVRKSKIGYIESTIIFSHGQTYTMEVPSIGVWKWFAL